MGLELFDVKKNYKMKFMYHVSHMMGPVYTSDLILPAISGSTHNVILKMDNTLSVPQQSTIFSPVFRNLCPFGIIF